MPKTNAPLPDKPKTRAWVQRHKVTSALLGLLTLLVLAVAGNWLVMQLQIRSERARFNAAASLLKNVAYESFNKNSQAIDYYNECSYTDNGAVFAIRSLGCGAGFKVFILNASESDAKRVLSLLKSNLHNRGMALKDNRQGMNSYDLAVYDFAVKGLSCAVTATYYTDDVPAYKRYSGVPDSGNGAFFEVDCSGPAKTPYFPVTSD